MTDCGVGFGAMDSAGAVEATGMLAATMGEEAEAVPEAVGETEATAARL